MMNIQRQLAACASVAVMVSITTLAHAGTRPFMTRGETVAAPTGFASMCERDDSACAVSAPVMTANAATTTAALSMSSLATSSLGRSWPAVLAAAKSAPAATADAGPGYDIASVESVEAYRPAAVEDFLPAGALRPAAKVAPAPVMVAEAPAAPAGPIQLSKSQMKLLNTVNRDVNRDVHKESDFNLYGLLEYWSLPRVIDGKMYGDCEDYALEKRRRLIAAGVPAETLSMAVVVTARGEGHAVLVVAMESGDVVLDNLSPWATPWEDLNYRWVQRQVAGTNAWTTVS
jgi:predicted transglutaminase-like cysteine proteinase